MTNALEDTRIDVFLRKPETVSKFEIVLGRGANAFISSALILINSDPKLQVCTTMSLYKSVLRAASLELSLDQSLRQAWIIARGKKVKSYKKENGEVVPEHYIQEASFQPHYNGLRALAERTRKYRVINVSPVYEGQRVWLDQKTGLHNVQLDNGLLTAPEQVDRFVIGRLDVTEGAPQKRVIGYLGYYKKHDGMEHTVWMTIKEIHDHAKQWAPDAYNSDYGAWKDPKKLPTMEMKTVFIKLTKTMDMSGTEGEKLRQAVELADGKDEDDVTTAEATFEEVGNTADAAAVKTVVQGVLVEGANPVPASATPVGFSAPASTDDNPDPVTDVTWKMYEDACAKVVKLGLKPSAVSRAKITNADLMGYIKELDVKIRARK